MRLVRSVSFLGGFVLANLIGASAFAAERQVYMNEAGWEVYLDRSASDPNEHVCKMITTDVLRRWACFTTLECGSIMGAFPNIPRWHCTSIELTGVSGKSCQSRARA